MLSKMNEFCIGRVELTEEIWIVSFRWPRDLRLKCLRAKHMGSRMVCT